MSTILKALRRLEEDKEKEAAAERLHGEVVAPATPDSRPFFRSFLGLVAIGLLSVAVGAGVFAALSNDSRSKQAVDVASSAALERAAPSTPSTRQAAAGIKYNASKRRMSSPAAGPVAAVARAGVDVAAGVPQSRGFETVPPSPVPSLAAPQVAARNEIATTMPAAQKKERPRPASRPRRKAAPPRGSPHPVAPIAPIAVASAAVVASAKDAGTPVEDLPIASESHSTSDPDPWEAPATQPAPESVAKASPAPATPEAKQPPAAETTAAPIQSVTVRRTIWHPSPKRRAAFLSIDGEEPVKIGEGEAYRGLLVKQISPSGVTIERGGEEITRRVGEGS